MTRKGGKKDILVTNTNVHVCTGMILDYQPDKTYQQLKPSSLGPMSRAATWLARTHISPGAHGHFP